MDKEDSVGGGTWKEISTLYMIDRSCPRKDKVIFLGDKFKQTFYG